MENFTFENKTKIIFGKDTELQIGSEVSKYSKKILLHYGQKSIKESGLYDKIVTSLKNEGISFIELSGVKPNPRLTLVNEGIKICRENSIDFILAVGGGSVIDSAKAIAAGVPYTGDVWDFFSNKAEVNEALPVATVLTFPAAGSEASSATVITNENGGYKRPLGNEHLRPVFSILNPELTYTLSKYQTACGVIDIMMHVLERYFTTTKNVDLTDRLCEVTVETVMRNMNILLNDPNDYNARAEIMWASTIAHNDILGTGRSHDWASHDIEHELSGIYDIAHGAGLAIVFPAWMKYVYKHNIDRFVQFANRIMKIDINFDNYEQTILTAIEAFESFVKKIGLPTTLKEVEIDNTKFKEMAAKATENGKLGNFVKLDKNDIIEILKLAES